MLEPTGERMVALLGNSEQENTMKEDSRSDRSYNMWTGG